MHPTPAVLAIGLLFCSDLVAQDVTGNLEGRVLGPDGQVLENVEVVATSPYLAGSRTAATDRRGSFLIARLSPGSYEVTVSRLGFRAVRLVDVQVRLGATTVLADLELLPEAVTLEPLVIRAGRAVIDPYSTTIGVNLERGLIASLPVDRNYRSIIELAPQANPSYLADEVNIGGSTGLENTYHIDGVNVTDPIFGYAGTNLPSNFIQGVSIKQGGYQAEHGRALGAVVDVTTRSGGEKLEANVFGFATPDVLTAAERPAVADMKAVSSSDYDAGLSIGGPLLGERSRFFAGYGVRVRNRSVVVPGFPAEQNRRIAHMLAGKLDWRAGDRTEVVLTALADPTDDRLVWNTKLDVFGAPAHLANIDPLLNRIRTGGAALSARVRSSMFERLLVESAVSYHTTRHTSEGTSERARTEPLFVNGATATWEGGVGDYWDTRARKLAAGGTATLLVSRHTLKAGIGLEHNRVERIAHTADPGVLIGDGLNITAVTIEYDGSATQTVPTAFLQDSWRLGERLTLNGGLRWGRQYFAGAGGTSGALAGEWQPRVGFVYELGRGARQKLFGSYGRYYQQLPLDRVLDVAVPWENNVFIYSSDPRAGGIDPDVSIILDNLKRWASGLQADNEDEFTAGYERLVGRNTRAAVRVLRQELRAAWGIALDASQQFLLGNLGRGELSFLPEPRREYSALELLLEHSASTGPSYLLSYVLSRTYGNYTGVYPSDANFPAPNNNMSFQVAEQAVNSTGKLPADRPHVLKLQGEYPLGAGLTLGTAMSVMSGTPINEFANLGFVFRPTFLVPRGSAGRTPTLWDLNLRLTADTRRLAGRFGSGRIIADLMHVGNPRRTVRVDQLAVVGVDAAGRQIRNPNYGHSVLTQSPMLVRLGLEHSF